MSYHRCLTLIPLLFLFSPASRGAESASLPSGMVGDYEITVTQVSRTDLFEPMPGNEYWPSWKAEPDHEILVVYFEAKNTKTGEIDKAAKSFFEGFSIETGDGEIVKSFVEKTNLRAVGFTVPQGVTARRFIIEGTSIDLEKK